MSLFFIERTNETADGTATVRLPVGYEDKDAATQGLKSMLAGYNRHGFNGENDYWWARDEENRLFRFFVVF